MEFGSRLILSLWLSIPAWAQSQPPPRIFDEKGQPIGEIKQNPIGGYDLYDKGSRRQGFGKEYPDGTIRFYGNG